MVEEIKGVGETSFARPNDEEYKGLPIAPTSEEHIEHIAPPTMGEYKEHIEPPHPHEVGMSVFGHHHISLLIIALVVVIVGVMVVWFYPGGEDVSDVGITGSVITIENLRLVDDAEGGGYVDRKNNLYDFNEPLNRRVGVLWDIKGNIGELPEGSVPIITLTIKHTILVKEQFSDDEYSPLSDLKDIQRVDTELDENNNYFSPHGAFTGFDELQGVGNYKVEIVAIDEKGVEIRDELEFMLGEWKN